MVKPFYITTAIDYPSSRFHLGHAYEKIVTDTIARWKRLQGYNVYFSTGTDCHGLKIERAAAKARKTPEEFVREISAGFKELCRVLNISYDDFIMTLEPRHKKVATAIVDQLYKQGDIYKGKYQGPYCVDCETYYTEKDLVNEKQCPVHKRDVEFIEEESYFFKLSKYKKDVIKAIESGYLWPEKKKNEMLARLKNNLRDVSISRDKVTWGIPLPFDNKKVIFVWIEALINYLSTIKYPEKSFREFWPAVHIIGSDIVWHHTVIWFSILKAIKLDIPKIVVHGFINLEGEKLSKARGINIDPIKLAENYGVDALRYFLMREIPFGEDGDFSEASLKKRLNNELANDLGNLVSRTLTIAEKNLGGKVRKKTIDKTLEKKLNIKTIEEKIDAFALHHALEEIWKFVNDVNRYINEKEPWKAENKEEIIYNVLESIRIIATLVTPFIPETAGKIFAQLKVPCGSIKDCTFGKVEEYKVKKGEILFKKSE